ncbi:MAG TPA: outer membrane lipid asymmetry maintenance protein MlaD [Burkholderiales bacterium]|nr:outer membrane lipid asymmetry maintenance protein MlaD [Burkholderiales bacterium]
MERSTLDLWVGLFVCAGIGALLILAMKVGNMASIGIGQDSYTIYANFDNIGGLKPRAPVKSAGVVVGRVASIAFDNNKFNARVALTIETKYKFPKDTGASILTSGLLGEQYIGLEAGGDSNDLADGETLKLTQSAVVLEKLISQFLYSKAAEGGDAPQAPAPNAAVAPVPAPHAPAPAAAVPGAEKK